MKIGTRVSAFLFFLAIGVCNAHAASSASPKPMIIIFLGDIYKINRTEFSLEHEVLDFVKTEKPVQVVILVCPLIHDSEAKKFEGKLLQVLKNVVISRKRLGSKAVECSRSGSREPLRNS
jgi:hypothetical protein